jgi:hypothetical protein
MRRTRTAQKVLPEFAVTTGCGPGRRDPEMISSILNAFAQVSAPVAELLTHHSAVFQPRATSMATDPSPPRSLLAPPLVQYNSHRRSRYREPARWAADPQA